MITSLFITAGVLVALSAASIRFNQYIDNLSLDDQPDGETANQVVAGVLYTLAGYAIVCAVWAQLLPRDWRLGPATAALMLLCFIASGWPMIRGDRLRQRTHRAVRQARDAQTQAKRILEDCYDE